MKVINNINKKLVLSILLNGLFISFSVFAEDTDVIDVINVTVPVSCTLSGIGMNTHNAEIQNGTYQPNVGTTTLHAFCNDKEGFSIYASGFTGDEIGEINSNKLVGTTASGSATIETGLATSAGTLDISNWAMKLAIAQDSGDTTGTSAITIDSAPNISGGANASFSQYHTVPNTFVRVAHKAAMTDMTESTGGAKLTATYAAYISKTQVADTYTGQVKYVLVHPYDSSASSIEISNPLAKNVIDNNIIRNNDLYELKSQTVEALKNSSSIPEGYKNLIKMDEIFGNPRCTRAELVEQLREVTTISREVENILLEKDSVRIAGEEVDLRVFNKPVDGVFVNDIKMGPVKFSWEYDSHDVPYQNMTLMAHEMMQNDYNFFDYDAFNEASVNDGMNSAGVNRYTRIRNIDNPITRYAIWYDGFDTVASSEIGYVSDIDSIDMSYGGIIDVAIDIRQTGSIRVNTNTGIVSMEGWVSRPETISMVLFHSNYEDVNDIIDNYIIELRDLIHDIAADYEIGYNGSRFKGLDQMINVSTLTAEEAVNLIRHGCGELDGCPSYDVEIYNRAKAKALLVPDEAWFDMTE